ncbi:hypothetical protein BS78_01G505500 [Paspalum vaginatum]|nr:hypothetical protein BS78_01G505500 [Paspalum vaginatum]
MASAAALLVSPLPPYSSSSDESDDDKPILPPTPVLMPEAASRTTQPQPRLWLEQERDCNLAMKELACAGDGVDEVVGLFEELKLFASSAGAAPNVLCYNTLLNALAEAGRVEEVGRAFDEMVAAGVAPSASTYNILVKLHVSRASDFGPAYEVISHMRARRVEPDVGTYSTLITGLCRAGRLDEAWGVLDWMLQEGCRPMVHTYTPIVQGYCRDGRIEQARELMAAMDSVGCPPNVVTYNVLIRSLCDGGRFDEVEQVLRESKTKGWEPSTVTYNTYMDGLCKKGMAKEALEHFDVMLGEGLELTSFTLSILLNCLLHDSRVSEAISVLHRSAWLLNCDAGVVAYNTVMSRLCDMGRWSGVLELLADMIKKGIAPNTHTFNILIHSLCIGGKSSAAKNMVDNQILAANVVTYNTLIHWLYSRGKCNEAACLIQDMKLKNIGLDEVTYTTIVDGLCRAGKIDKAIHWLIESFESELWRDSLYVLINRLVGRDDGIKVILNIFREMEKIDILLDHKIFDHTIRALCKVGFCQYRNIYTLDTILDIMLARSTRVKEREK